MIQKEQLIVDEYNVIYINQEVISQYITIILITTRVSIEYSYIYKYYPGILLYLSE